MRAVVGELGVASVDVTGRCRGGKRGGAAGKGKCECASRSSRTFDNIDIDIDILPILPTLP